MHNLKDVLTYESETGILFWSCDIGKKIKEGDIAGTPNGKRGGIAIKYDGIKYLAHRIAYYFMTGSEPAEDEMIVHKNEDLTDNRWDNLTVKSRSEIQANQKLQAKSLTGHKNITWSKSHSKYQVVKTIKGKQYHLGYYDTIDEAADVLRAKISVV